jgi:hypothetical protein
VSFSSYSAEFSDECYVYSGYNQYWMNQSSGNQRKSQSQGLDGSPTTKTSKFLSRWFDVLAAETSAQAAAVIIGWSLCSSSISGLWLVQPEIM